MPGGAAELGVHLQDDPHKELRDGGALADGLALDHLSNRALRNPTNPNSLAYVRVSTFLFFFDFSDMFFENAAIFCSRYREFLDFDV